MVFEDFVNNEKRTWIMGLKEKESISDYNIWAPEGYEAYKTEWSDRERPDGTPLKGYYVYYRIK